MAIYSFPDVGLQLLIVLGTGGSKGRRKPVRSSERHPAAKLLLSGSQRRGSQHLLVR
jgi:hypothetical protein